MKIVINTFGTRGDVQPYIAMGLGLRQSGHDVRIFTHQIFEPFVRAHGLDFYPLNLNPREVMVDQTLAELGSNTFRIMRWITDHFQPVLREAFVATIAANADAELMLNTGLSFVGWHVAEKLAVPALAAYLWPVTPSRFLAGANGNLPPAWLPFKGAVRYYTTKLSNQLFFNLLRSPVNTCREDILGLPPLSARYYWALDQPESPQPFLYGYSPSVLPKPPDWSEHQQVTGYWFLDEAQDYQPEPALREFLASGPPPVYAGFGSLVDHERDALTRMVVEALRETGQRGVLLGGWGALGEGDLPGSLLRLESVPHDWLFPRVAAVVHHGGAGTTAAGLRAGVPGVVVPSFADQFFWGRQVQRLGVGAAPIPRKQLSAEKLASAIHQVVNDDAIKAKASQLGQQIRAENGVETAVILIERFARQGRF